LTQVAIFGGEQDKLAGHLPGIRLFTLR